jgi:hypothetical protein
MSTGGRRSLRVVPPAQKDKKRRHLGQRAEEIYDAGYSGTTTAVNYEAVATASGSELREVAYEIPAPVLPIPMVSLPEVVEDVTWTHDDPAVPLVQFGETPYVTSTTASHTQSAARAGEPSVVSRTQRSPCPNTCANDGVGSYEQVESTPRRLRGRASSPRLARRRVPRGPALRDVRHAVWRVVPLHGLLLRQDALQ